MIPLWRSSDCFGVSTAKLSRRVHGDGDTATLRRLAKRHGWKLSKAKRGFLIQGQDRAGAAYGHHEKLARSKINVTAADAVCAGKGRYGMILWVKPKDYNRAAKVLRAK